MIVSELYMGKAGIIKRMIAYLLVIALIVPLIETMSEIARKTTGVEESAEALSEHMGIDAVDGLGLGADGDTGDTVFVMLSCCQRR